MNHDLPVIPITVHPNSPREMAYSRPLLQGKIIYSNSPVGLFHLTKLSNAELETYDIAFLNLVCWEGMPGFSLASVDASLKKLDEWAAHVAYETERRLHRFEKQPQAFRNNEGYFRMLTLVSVVQQDFGAIYNPQHVSTPDNPESDRSFFSDPMDVFIHGFTDRAEPMGTCSSFPVLYTAIAQRLRYPVFLVSAKEHLFCRWDDGENQLNIEGTSSGLNCHSDSYYMNWPRSMSEAECQENHHLKSMTAKEVLSAFLSIRGSCMLHGKNKPKEAWESFKLAFHLSPHVKNYQNAASVLQP